MKSLKSMIIAWGASLTVLIAIGVLLEVGHDPEEQLSSQEQDAVADQHAKITASVAIVKKPDEADAMPVSERFQSPGESEPQEPIAILPPPTFVVVQEDSDLIELGAEGLLPRRGTDGKVSWQTYASPLPVDTEKPRIAIIVTDMGLNKKQTTEAIEKLPAAVTFAFSPYGLALNDWRNLVRTTGHEILMLLPMEPVNYPQSDAGKYSLLTNQDSLENINTLHTVMGKMVGYVGIMNHMGSKFMTQQPVLRPILNEMHIRGLMFVDARTTQFSKGATIAQAVGMPRAVNDAFIDNITSEEEILIQLQDLQNRARSRGVAVGVARNYPLSIAILQKWAKELPDQGFQLVPITATVNRQPIS